MNHKKFKWICIPEKSWKRTEVIGGNKENKITMILHSLLTVFLDFVWHLAPGFPLEIWVPVCWEFSFYFPFFVFHILSCELNRLLQELLDLQCCQRCMHGPSWSSLSGDNMILLMSFLIVWIRGGGAFKNVLRAIWSRVGRLVRFVDYCNIQL